MARKTVGAWIRGALRGQTTNALSPGIGMHVITNEGIELGTINAVWRGAEATDGAHHEDTLGVHRPDQGEWGQLYVPAAVVARVSDQGVVLTVDGAQAIARDWRFRPQWLSVDEPAR